MPLVAKPALEPKPQIERAGLSIRLELPTCKPVVKPRGANLHTKFELGGVSKV